MGNNLKKYVIFAVLLSVITPTFVLASWWNPFSWDFMGFWNKLFNKDIKTESIDTTGWKTYTNKQIGFEIKYPQDWGVREFPDTKNGAGFRPPYTIEEPASEVITVQSISRPMDYCMVPFSDYARMAFIKEVQGAKKLNSIEEIKNENGIKIYKTIWNYEDARGKPALTLPIAYFGNQKLTCQSPQASLSDKQYENIFDEMIKTFKFIEGTDQSKDWIKCVGKCGFYQDEVIGGNMLQRSCVDACTPRYNLPEKYKDLPSAILFLSPKVEYCQKITKSSLADKCLEDILLKYQTNN